MVAADFGKGCELIGLGDDRDAGRSDPEVAVTTLELVPDSEGWISHGWCAAEGDPLGPHRLDVSADGVELAKFEFDVVAATSYKFPAVPAPDPSGRTTNNSW